MIHTLTITGPLFAAFAHYFFAIAMSLVAVFLILLVLVQRGRGGGLAGAFGGMGGQSAFGTKAGDAFTRVTIGVSICWILLCVAAVRFLGTSTGPLGRASSPDQPAVAPGPLGTPADTPLLPSGPEGADGSGQPSQSPASTPDAPGSEPANGGSPAEVTSETPFAPSDSGAAETTPESAP